MIVGAVGGCLLLGLWFWNGAVLERKIRQATALQGRLASQTTGVTGLRIWGAGERQTKDHFCQFARVPRPELILYETKNLDEISEFASRIKVRPHLSLDPEYATCGPITIDFLRGDNIVLSLHLIGTHLRTWGASLGSVPITDDSHAQIEAWMKNRGIRERLEQEILRVGVWK